MAPVPRIPGRKRSGLGLESRQAVDVCICIDAIPVDIREDRHRFTLTRVVKRLHRVRLSELLCQHLERSRRSSGSREVGVFGNCMHKPMEVREKWVEMMNAAMERHGHIHDPAQRLDARSWADQGRPDLAELR